MDPRAASPGGPCSALAPSVRAARFCRTSCRSQRWTKPRPRRGRLAVPRAVAQHVRPQIVRVQYCELSAGGEVGKRAQEAAALALHRSGVLLLELPEGSPVIGQVTRAAATARKFFSMDADLKERHCSGNHGYRDEPATGFESFEVRSIYPRAFAWPPRPAQLRAEFTALHAALSGIARELLVLSFRHLGVQDGPQMERLKAALLDDAAHANLETCSPSCLRFLHYAHPPARSGGRFVLRNAIHADNSLITLAPRSSCSALQVRLFSPEARAGAQAGVPGACWVDIEEEMTHRDLVVYAGDSLALLSGHYYPALVHQVGGDGVAKALRDRESQGAAGQEAGTAGGRLSMPFFLRPRRNALLDVLPRDVAPRVPAVPGGPWQVSFAQVDSNAMFCRDNWPWKRLPYYADQQFIA